MQSYVWPAPSHMNPHCVSFCRESSEWHSTTVILNIIYSHTLFTYCFFSSLPGRHTEEKKKKKKHRNRQNIQKHAVPCTETDTAVIICSVPRVQVSYRCPFTALHTPGTEMQYKHSHAHTQSRNSQQPACTVQQAKQHFIKLSRIFLPLYFASDWTNGINNVCLKIVCVWKN